MVVAATALVEGKTTEDAAQLAEIGRTTLYEWRTLDSDAGREFRGILRDIRERWEREFVDDTVRLALSRLRSAADPAVNRLIDLLDAQKLVVTKTGDGFEAADNATRRAAAEAILKRIQEFIPAERLEVSGTLEQTIAELDAKGTNGSD
jgi:hypothetical protein